MGRAAIDNSLLNKSVQLKMLEHGKPESEYASVEWNLTRVEKEATIIEQRCSAWRTAVCPTNNEGRVVDQHTPSADKCWNASIALLKPGVERPRGSPYLPCEEAGEWVPVIVHLVGYRLRFEPSITNESSTSAVQASLALRGLGAALSDVVLEPLDFVFTPLPRENSGSSRGASRGPSSSSSTSDALCEFIQVAIHENGLPNLQFILGEPRRESRAPVLPEILRTVRMR